MAPLPVITVPLFPPLFPLFPLGPHLYVPIRPVRGSTRPRNELESAVKRLENITNLTTGVSPYQPLTSGNLLPPLTGPGQVTNRTQHRPALNGGSNKARSKSSSELQTENKNLKKEMGKIKKVLLDTQKTLLEAKKGFSVLQKQLSDARKELKKCKADNEELAQALERKPGRSKSTKTPLIGSFCTKDVRPDTSADERTSKHMTFSRPYSSPPGIPVGLYHIDLSREGRICLSAFITNLDATGFDINIDGDKVHAGGAVWLEIDPDSADFQFGRYSTHDDHPWAGPPLGTHERRISFPHPYAEPPQVLVWLSAFDLGKDRSWRLKTYVSNITATGFTIHLDKWLDTEYLAAAATWIAYPNGKKGVASGSFNTLDIRPDTQPALQNSGPVLFPKEAAFKRAPERIKLGINALDITCERNMRLELVGTEVTSKGMNWRLNGWKDTVLHSAGGSYIAFE